MILPHIWVGFVKLLSQQFTSVFCTPALPHEVSISLILKNSCDIPVTQSVTRLHSSIT